MRVNIIYGVANISDSARIQIRKALTAAKHEVVDDSIVRGIKSGIDQAVASYASPEQLVLILSCRLEEKNPFTINDLLRYQKEVPNVKIVFVIEEDMKGSELLKDMSDNGMYLAMYSRETSANLITNLIVTGRTVEEAKRYYGVIGVKNVSKQITIDGAIAHMTQPVKNNKEYLERIRWVRSVIGSEDAFVVCVKRLPDEIKDVLADTKAFYPYVEDYVITRASSVGRSDDKSGGSLLGKFKSKAGKSKEDKKEKEELSKQTAEEKAAAEAEKRAEAERVALEKKAEAERIEAEKKAERERKEAEKAEARERKEAEKQAERERREAEKAEAQKKAEELRAQQEEERRLRAEEEAQKRAAQKDLEAELAVLQKQAAAEKAEQDALRQERIRIEAEAKAKAEMEYRAAEAERKRAEAEERAAAKAAAKAERGGLSGYATGGAKKSPAVTVGREDICIYSLRHGTGTSYVAASIANYLSKNRKGDVSLVLNDTDYTDEIVSPRVGVFPWTREGEAFNKSNYIVHDIGVYGEMTPDRRVSLQRASTKIILCKADGRFLTRLADHVESIDTKDVIFIFTELPAEWEKRVYDVMDFTRNVYCIPTFYSLSPNAQVLKVYNEIFKRK